jgi:hypothetical protein
MKPYKSSAIFLILALILLTLPQPSRADQQWHYQASAQVAQPGLIETVLPAGVFFGTDNAVKMSRLDLTLVGPDNNPRFSSFSGKATRGRAALRSSLAARSSDGTVSERINLPWPLPYRLRIMPMCMVTAKKVVFFRSEE